MSDLEQLVIQLVLRGNGPLADFCNKYKITATTIKALIAGAWDVEVKEAQHKQWFAEGWESGGNTNPVEYDCFEFDAGSLEEERLYGLLNLLREWSSAE